MQKRLYIFIGYPGAGKTTVARIIAKATGAIHLWVDQERHKMFKQPTHSQAESQQLYDHLNKLTDELLATDKSVVFDTNFNYLKDREHLRKIAIKNNAEVITIWVTTPKALARMRATEDSHGKETRIWGNMATEDFDAMSNRLEEPSDYENAVLIDGTNIDPEALKQQLNI